MTTDQQETYPEPTRESMIAALRYTIHDFFIKEDEDSDPDDAYNYDAQKPYWDTIYSALIFYSDAQIKSLYTELAGKSRMTKAEQRKARMVFDGKNEGFMMAADVLGPHLHITAATSNVRELLEGLELWDRNLGSYLHQFETFGVRFGPQMITALNTICAIQNRYEGESYQSGTAKVLGYVSGKATPFINDRRVAAILKTRPQDTDRIIELVIARGAMSQLQMEAILDSPTPALSDGVL